MRTKINAAVLLFVLLCVPGVAGLASSSSQFIVVPLVSDQAGAAANTDLDLVNPWGIAHAPDGPNWVSNNGTNKVTVYDRNTGAKLKPVVTTPKRGGRPTGIVYVPPGSGFLISADGDTFEPSIFLIATERGSVEGWNPKIRPKDSVIAVKPPSCSECRRRIFTGLALGHTGNGPRLFVADFANNLVRVFDNNFQSLEKEDFTDNSLPKNFAPFNVAWIDNRLYVLYAEREVEGFDEVHGKGLGYVDVFDARGNLQQQLIVRGSLNAPWGITIAPKQFGSFAGTLLVGNFGDGAIHAYDATTGAFIGTLKNTEGTGLKIDGLWALDAGPNSFVTFTAGPAGETHGLLGLISPPPNVPFAAH